MGKCRTCKYWYKGEKIHYSEGSVEWNGKPSLKAGTTEIKRNWSKVGLAEFIGQCMSMSELKFTVQDVSIKELHRLVTSINKDEILTSGDFGCNNWAHDQGKDKFSHTYVDSRGQQTLEDYKNEMKLQPEFEEPVGIKWTSKGVGWLFYENKDSIKCEPEWVPAAQARVEIKDKLSEE